MPGGFLARAGGVHLCPLPSAEIVTLQGNKFVATRIRRRQNNSRKLPDRPVAETEREERSGPSVEACGRKLANSFPAREDLDISRHKGTPRLFILPKRLDRDISKPKKEQWGGGRVKGEINAAENGE